MGHQLAGSRIVFITAALALLLVGGRISEAHNVGDAVLWNREISRIFYQRCASCHRDDGTAFSLMTFQEAQPHAAAIKDAVLSRRMPPWGAVKGFGDFRNDQGLSQEEIALITDWVDSNTPRGNNANVLPQKPKFPKLSAFKLPKNAVPVSGTTPLKSALTLDGFFPEQVPPDSSIKIVAMFPDGHAEPLLWLYEYKNTLAHPFFLRKGLSLPAGTVIHGVPASARVFLLPGKGK
jgi:mono/diheme cytochrome c family protein